MKPFLIPILILSSLTSLMAQSSSDSLILTKEQGYNWILKLEKETKPDQLDLIRHRILLDTNVYIRQRYAHAVKIDSEKERGSRTEGYCKPILIFNGQYIADINNHTKGKSIQALADLLTDDQIKSLLIMKDIEATALYGSSGECGVILFTTKNKKILKRIKQINFGR